MLNLRQVAEVEQSSVSAGTAHRSTLLFNADVIVGNMGESLNFDVNNDEEDSDADTDTGRNDREGIIEDLSDGPVGMTVEANEAPHDSSGENVIEVSYPYEYASNRSLMRPILGSFPHALVLNVLSLCQLL